MPVGAVGQHEVVRVNGRPTPELLCGTPSVADRGCSGLVELFGGSGNVARALFLRIANSNAEICRPRCRQSVVINLRFRDGAAMLMGIENFVCEVQLVLSEFGPLLQVVWASFQFKFILQQQCTHAHVGMLDRDSSHDYI